MGDLGLLRSLLPTFKLCPMGGRVSPKSARLLSLNRCENFCGLNGTILSYRQRGLSAGKWPDMSNYGILRESLFIGKTKPRHAANVGDRLWSNLPYRTNGDDYRRHTRWVL